jgi:uncharacterized repeat protein (TIGR03803 family)
MKPYLLAAALCAAAFVSGCAHGAGSGGPGYFPADDPNMVRSALATTGYSVIHDFEHTTSVQDGYFPVAGLISVKGALYGTAPYTNKSGASVPGGGVAFSMTTSGTEDVLHAFGTGDDAATPFGDLIDDGGTFYGTSEYGGKGDHGTVFTMSQTGAEHVLYAFGATASDGRTPQAGLLSLNGTLYGTTELGGNGTGTVFSLASGKEQVLHRFGKDADGQYPMASLIAVNGTLYGTTQAGGTNRDGTVFSITTTGTEKVIYSFRSGTDGARPAARLIALKGVLYGTTEYGGAYGDGTVFSVTPTGAEHVLHSFGGNDTDGREPVAGLIAIGKTLYGTTSVGGAYDHVYGGGGTLFTISSTGVEKILHNFGSLNDGARPVADLVNVSGMLYGTTEFGGTDAAGTIFAMKP